MDADFRQSSATRQGVSSADCGCQHTNLKPEPCFSHCLPDVLQVLLYVVYDLHSSLRDPGSWAEHGTDAALVQELVVLRAQTT